MPSPRIMIVEDENIVALDIRTRLEDLGYAVSGVASSGEEALEKAGELRPDLVLMDIMLRGQMDGVEASRRIRRQLDIPCVFLTAHADDATLQRAKVTDPFGYIIKPFEEKELRSNIEIALYKFETEKRLFESRQWLSAILESMADGVIATDVEGRVSFLNAAGAAMTGWSEKEVAGRKLDDILHFLRHDSKEPAEDPVTQVRERGWNSIPPRDLLIVGREGRETPVAASAAPLLDRGGRGAGVVLVFRDATLSRKAEEYLRKTERLQSIARLAGGIAHEFNNLLTVIQGHSELLLGRLRPEDETRGKIEQIDSAARRAAALTRQMMAFSGQQQLQPEPLDLNRLTAGLANELKELLGPGISLELQPGAGLAPVEADAGQLRFVLRELASNARAAMSEGGRFRLRTESVILDEEFVETHPGSKPGPAVLLEVSDTGAGMPPDVRQKIFEPFFTTKGRAVRPGMGLATVYGIVKQSRGNLYVESEAGRGARFEIYLPRTAKSPHASGEGEAMVRPEDEVRQVTILLVDDEDSIRRMISQLMAGRGFAVHPAANTSEALRFSEEFSGEIDLLVTDVVLPGMSGRELAERLLESRPGMRVLFTSGYPEREALRDFPAEMKAPFLQKPYSLSGLLDIIKAMSLHRPVN